MAWRRRARERPTGHHSPEPWKLAVAIYRYGAGSTIIIPLPGADRAAAESYLAQLKSDVIDAQRHSLRQLRLGPFRPSDESLVVDPSEIERVGLVDRPAPGGGSSRP